MTEIHLKRVYNEPDPSDGYRILVDRLWPRGMSKERIRIDQWAKALAPSTELRKAWHHDPDQFEHFAHVYRSELEKTDAVSDLLETLDEVSVITFVFASKNEELNHAVVLREYCLERYSRRERE
ncbi:DUF488 domain-containing protein [Glutamicibacter sp. JC586]|uniref:DUF488 domain-containing protein n=1 Tax=Glutamicibacter sp. JC586 TaxID=2590552 RepID=UPI00135C7B3F|nr:DUF488 family protein [Glutamicibacter sp. JC586]